MGGLEGGLSEPENRVRIPVANWPRFLAEAIKSAQPGTVIVVDDDAKRELALEAAQDMGKQISVEVEERQ